MQERIPVPSGFAAPSSSFRSGGGRAAKSEGRGVHFPIRILAATTVLTLVVLTVLSSFLWRSVTDLQELGTREFRMRELTGVITHLDEVLTMSALQAAATGDVAWEERYGRYEPVLDGAIKEAAQLAPEAFDSRAAAQTDAANALLVAMEHGAFDLARQGRRDQAMALLSSAEYRAQKHTYSEGLQRIVAAIDSRVATAISAQRQRAVLALASAAAGMLVLVVAWSVALSALRKYMSEHERAERLQAAIYEISEATQQAESLDELFGRIHSIVGRLMEARNLYIALFDADENLVRFPYFVDEADEPPAPRAPGRGLTELVLRSGKPVLATPEVFEDLVREGEVESMGAPSVDWLGVPLIVGDRTLGALVVQSYTGGMRYGDREKDILTFVCRQIALAIERKRTEGILRESEERYRLVMQRAPVGVFHYGTDLRITDCNERFINILRSRRERLIGLDMNLLKDQRVLPAIRAAALGGYGEYEGRYRATTGDAELVVALRTAPLHGEDGTIIGSVGIVEDTTKHRQLEEQLLHSQKMESIGSLAGGVAHDFNNLLQAMLSHAQLLRRFSGDPAKVPDVVGELERQINRGAALTRQLLVFSRRETVKPELVDLNEVVREATQFLQRLVRANIALVIDLAPRRLAVEADRGQLQQVLMNLTVNASDAMPEGGRLVVRTGAVGEAEASLTVEDTGHGIPEGIRERIFEPFFTTKELGKGTGLGLSVVHGIVTGHGGRIEVESADGRGSSFRVFLPLVTDDVPAVEKGTSDAAPLATGAGERILIVEDEDAAREGLQQILASLGYEVAAVASGEEAAVLQADRPFNLLLTDLMLPGVTGSQLAADLLVRWPALKVILMSGYHEDDAVRRAVSEGGVRFLQKPFDMATLAREVHAGLHAA